MHLKYLSSPYAILMRFGICSLRETLGPDRIYRPKYIATPEMEQLAKDPTSWRIASKKLVAIIKQPWITCEPITTIIPPVGLPGK